MSASGSRAPARPAPAVAPGGLLLDGAWVMQARQRPGAPEGVLDVRPERQAALGDALAGVPLTLLARVHSRRELICHDTSAAHMRYCAEELARERHPGRGSSALADCMVLVSSSRSALLSEIREAGLTCRSTEAFCAMSPDLQVQAFMASPRRLAVLGASGRMRLQDPGGLPLPQAGSTAWEPLPAWGRDRLTLQAHPSGSQAVLAWRGSDGRWSAVSAEVMPRQTANVTGLVCSAAEAPEAAEAIAACFGKVRTVKMLSVSFFRTCRAARCGRDLAELIAVVGAPREQSLPELRRLARYPGMARAGTAGAGELKRMLAEHAALSGQSPAGGPALKRPIRYADAVAALGRPPIEDIGAAGAVAAVSPGSRLVHPGFKPVAHRAMKAWGAGFAALERPASPYRRPRA